MSKEAVRAPVRTISAARDTARTAPARCLCYAAFSELIASPHDADAAGSAGERIGAGAGLPFAAPALDGLLAELAASDPEARRTEYSGLFEVGSKGPPAPIREDLQTGQRSGTREDIVRFYDYFGYRLDDRFAWAPDHLSVELEFMHFLCFHEARESADRCSYQLAQADFTARHLANWVPQLAQAVAKLAPGSFYARVLDALADFVACDLAWQRGTIVEAPEVTRP
jgi:DMSO reductase family type II enzyme chaperone